MLDGDAGVHFDELVDRFAVLRAQNPVALGESVTDADLSKAYLGILLRREDRATIPG